jgi:hypothetical protein
MLYKLQSVRRGPLALSWNWPALIGGQIALLLGIGVVRAFFTPNHQEK